METIRVLIVDDIPGYAEILASRLERTGWVYYTATSGAEALRILQGPDSIDILACDFHMPEIDGAQLVNRALAIRPDLYTIVFTAWNEREYAVKSLRVGADAFLDKTDYLDSELGEAIRRGVQRITLSRIGRQLLKIEREEEIFDLLFSSLCRLHLFDGCCLAARSVQGDVCRVDRAIDLNSGKELPAGKTVGDDSAYRYVIDSDRAYLPPIFQPELDLRNYLSESRSIVVVPVMLRAGERGALGIEHHEEKRLGIDDLHFLSQIAHWISLAMEKLTHQERVLAEREWSRAYRDYLARAVLHEVKNSLYGLSLVADVEGEKLDPKNRAVLRNGIDRINAAVNKILRPLIRKDEEPDCINMEDAVREAIAQLQLHEFTRPPKLRVKVQPSLPPINGSRELIVQALVNLLENSSAAAANTGEEGEVYVLVSCAAARERIEVVIQDNGKGFREEDVDRVFDYGYSTRGEGHSGIGLALTKDIVALHGGRIDLKSEPGRGASFILSLPFAVPENDLSKVGEV